MNPKISINIRLHIACAFLLCASVCGGEQAIGWRNDGTGHFPAADPPTKWGRVSAELKGLRFLARKPAGPDASGTPMPDGVVREWLVLGPVPVPAETPKAIEQDTFANELELSPDEGDNAGDLAWNKITVDHATLEFEKLLGAKIEIPAGGTAPAWFAYAHTHVFSETGGDFVLQLTHRRGARVMVNGKQLGASGGADGRRISVKLTKGWNRLLLKVENDKTQWFAVPLFTARVAHGYDENNLAWMTPLPGARVYQGTPAGPGGPIVVGDKIFLLCEPHDLFCLNKHDGKVLWAKSNSYFDALTDEERNARPEFKEIEPLAAKWNTMNAEYVAGKVTTPYEQREKLEKELYDALRKIDKKFTRPGGQDVGYAGFTPSSDGKLIYAWFATGVTACYDLEGNRLWIRTDNHETVEHGFSSSPVLADGKFFVFMRELMAFDAKTGKELWRNPLVGPKGMNPAGWFHGSLGHARIGGIETVVSPSGTIVRASDGKTLFTDPKLVANQSVASPIIDSGLLYLTSTWSETLSILRLPDTAGETIAPAVVHQVKMPTDKFPQFYLGWHIASPLVHDGLVYSMNNNGLLTVVDAKAGMIVYQRMLDVDPFQGHNEASARGLGTSPALAGGHLYFFGNGGTTLVIEPGREFKRVAKNKIEGFAMKGTWGERQDRTVANPFFDGKHIYYRTESGLYAIGPR